MITRRLAVLSAIVGLLFISGAAYALLASKSAEPLPISSYPSISSTTTDASCRTGACTMNPSQGKTSGSQSASTTTNKIKPGESTAGMKYVMTTLFWVGEPSDADNDFIPNDASAWESEWQSNYGGVDSMDCRKEYLPCGFTPRENPFYFALPYNDLAASGLPKPTQKLVPWYTNELATKNTSVLKNHWIKITYGSKTCFAQWQDVGPNEEDDFSYVFGSTQPKNTFGEKAGLDVSPATWQCLGLKDNARTYWAFVDEKDVPPGPWRDTLTVSGVAW